MASSIAREEDITTAPTFEVKFPLPMDTADYTVKISTFPSTIGGQVDPNSRTVNGFKVINLTGLGRLWYLTRQTG